MCIRDSPEVYDGKNIPVAADDAVFRLKVGLADLNDPEAAEAGAVSVSYTHLDVYKRQSPTCSEKRFALQFGANLT